MFKAEDPESGKTWFFFDKCLPFGSAVSCQIYPKFLNALAWVVTQQTGKKFVNYLDDFFFVDKATESCNAQVKLFLDVAEHICLPVSLEKTK